VGGRGLLPPDLPGVVTVLWIVGVCHTHKGAQRNFPQPLMIASPYPAVEILMSSCFPRSTGETFCFLATRYSRPTEAAVVAAEIRREVRMIEPEIGSNRYPRSCNLRHWFSHREMESKNRASLSKVWNPEARRYSLIWIDRSNYKHTRLSIVV